MINVIQVIPTLERGGAEDVALRLAAGLSPAKIESELLVLSETGIQDRTTSGHIDGLKISFVKNSASKFHARSWILNISHWYFQNRHRLLKSDVLHAHLTKSLCLCLLIKFESHFSIRKNKKIPKIVFTVHGVGSRQSFLRRVFNSLTIPFVDALVLVAQDDYWTKITNRFSKNGKLSLVVKNGIKLSPTTGFDTKKDRAGNIQLGTLTRLNQDRLPFVYLDLVEEICRTSNLQFEFQIGGGGSMLDSLLQEVAKRDLENVITFKGVIYDSREFLKSLDLFITINTGETTGVAALEAIAAGVPVISYQRLPGYEASSEDWIWSSQSVGLLASKIISLINSDVTLKKMIENQTQFLQKNFTEKQMVDSYQGVYFAAMKLSA